MSPTGAGRPGLTGVRERRKDASWRRCFVPEFSTLHCRPASRSKAGRPLKLEPAPSLKTTIVFRRGRASFETSAPCLVKRHDSAGPKPAGPNEHRAGERAPPARRPVSNFTRHSRRRRPDPGAPSAATRRPRLGGRPAASRDPAAPLTSRPASRAGRQRPNGMIKHSLGSGSTLTV